MADERTRYSDAELEEFKQLILKKLENARADYELLRATITHTADNDTEDTSPTFKVLEEGAATLSKEESGRLAAHQMKFIRNLEMALVRIENKTYGICKTTGKLIPKEHANEYYGFFDIFGRYASVMGTFLVSVVTSLTGNPSLGVLSIGVLLVVGFMLLVRLSRMTRAAEHAA